MLPVIDPALLDVDCPLCLASPLELCSVGIGRFMESTVHLPRRVRADVPLVAEEPEPTTPRQPKARKTPKPPKPRRTKTVRPRGSRTHCRHGHEYTEANTYRPANGARRCRTCDTDAKRRFREAKGITPRGPLTHCKHGHEYTPDNTATQANGTRICRTCKRARDNRANTKRRAKV